MRGLESILRGVERPLPTVAHARTVWRAYRHAAGYKGDATLMGAPTTNAKLSKGIQRIYGLTLLPAGASGVNVCPFATDGCEAACVLMTAGRGVMSNVRRAREVKTLFAAEHPAEFLALLNSEVQRVVARGDSIIRLNVASDIRWEYVAPELFSTGGRFYDYTKWPTDSRSPLANYVVVYSRNERDGDAPAVEYLSNGGNVAVVFDTLPDTWHGFPVINGDAHDDRTADGGPVVVGLLAKGAARTDASGFVVRAEALVPA
jgi:hypothetical protein